MSMNNDPNRPQQPFGQPPSGPSQWEQPTQQEPFGQPPQQWGQQPPIPQYNQPPYYPNQPQYAAPPEYQQPRKRSLRWLWITLGIIGGIIVLGCIGCGVLAATGYNFFKSSVGPAVTASQYYQALKETNYTQAYSYLDPTIAAQGGAASQSLFTKGAQAADTIRGPIRSYTVAVPKVNNNNATITLTVTRNNAPYTVQLTLQQVNGDWKITGVQSPLGLY